MHGWVITLHMFGCNYVNVITYPCPKSSASRVRPCNLTLRRNADRFAHTGQVTLEAINPFNHDPCFGAINISLNPRLAKCLPVCFRAFILHGWYHAKYIYSANSTLNPLSPSDAICLQGYWSTTLTQAMVITWTNDYLSWAGSCVFHLRQYHCACS